MSSPREKEGKNQDDKEVPGPALPTTANKKTEPNELDNRDVDQEWITIRSRADPFRRWFADLQRRQAGSRAAPSTALAPAHRILISVERGNESAAEIIIPAGAGRLTVRNGKTVPE